MSIATFFFFAMFQQLALVSLYKLSSLVHSNRYKLPNLSPEPCPANGRFERQAV